MAYTPRRSSVSNGRGSDDRPNAAFDSNVPEGVDPEANWRLANSRKYGRAGSTAAERSGNSAGYTPGYGRSAAGNRPSGFTSDWAGQFKPQLQMPGSNAAPADPGMRFADPNVPSSVLPPAANAATVAPAAPARPPVAPMATQPRITNQTFTQGAVRQVTGLPAGQRAMASFVPGQNSPANLAKRTRPPVDPFA